jgi:formate hydrogenlyase subunit 3/multisubunit Na+/H+ antiporter MnhD subunit
MFIFFWLAFAAAVGFLASKRGRNPALWGVLALLISPLVSVIFLLIADDRSTPPA